MAESTNYQCPNCNGRLFYNGEMGQLQCEFCESTFSPQEVEALYAQKQAKADAAASGDRAAEVAAETGVGETLTEAQTNAMNAAYEQAIQEGKSEQEAAVIAQQAAAGAVATTASAATASTAEATHVEARHAATGDPIQDYLANAKWSDADVDNMVAYNCPSCGAQLMVDQVTAVTSCPYCGNNTVLPGQLSDVLKPDLIIPFKLDKGAAVASLKQYYGGKRFLPDGFTEGNHLEEVQGVYVPFWLYSGTANGDFSFAATNSRTWSDSENMYTETDHYDLHRVGSMNFYRVPVDGSTKMPDAHMDAIEPFDYSGLVPFSVAYLPGYLTDRYDLDVSQCDPRARSRVENTCASAIEGSISGYESVSVQSSNTNVEWSDVSYALMPVWMLHTKWNGDDYLFAMNGQTGKFIGDLPIDPGKVRKRFLILYLPIAIVLAVVLFGVFGTNGLF